MSLRAGFEAVATKATMSVSSSMDVLAPSGIFLICRRAALKKEPEKELGAEARGNRCCLLKKS